MSSRKPVSTARPHTFWSIEYGDFFVVAIGRPLLLGEGDRLVAGHAGVADRGEHLQVRAEGADADLEAHLVVALAGAAVGDHRGAVVLRGGDEVLDDQRPGQRGDQRVAVHVEGVGLQRREAELVGVLVAHVGDDRLDRAAVERALADDVHVLAALADVAGDGDHLGAGLLGDPADGHGGVQATRVGQDDTFGHGALSSRSVFSSG